MVRHLSDSRVPDWPDSMFEDGTKRAFERNSSITAKTCKLHIKRLRMSFFKFHWPPVSSLCLCKAFTFQCIHFWLHIFGLLIYIRQQNAVDYFVQWNPAAYFWIYLVWIIVVSLSHFWPLWLLKSWKEKETMTYRVTNWEHSVSSCCVKLIVNINYFLNNLFLTNYRKNKQMSWCKD